MFNTTKNAALSLLSIALLLLGGVVLADSPGYPQSRIIAGGPDSFVQAEHVILRGSNYEIGQQMAEFAKGHGISVTRAPDSLVSRVKREYLRDSYPAYYERMRGLADGLGLTFDDSNYDFSVLWQPMVFGMGCSMVFFPNSSTENGHGILSRNYDFTTGTIRGVYPDSGFLPVNSRPFVMEIHPDDGYASIAVCDFDVLGGVIDGINSEGLTVAIASESETTQEYGMERGNEVGLHELQGMRYLLDNCATVQEAKAAMMKLKHFYFFIPCHYLVGDKLGNSCIIEFSSQRNRLNIIDGAGPQCITNHQVARYKSLEGMPEDWTYERFRNLTKAISIGGEFSAEQIESISASVRPTFSVSPDSRYAPIRTIWHALYDTHLLELKVKFYLGESTNAAGDPVMRYTDYFSITLES